MQYSRKKIGMESAAAPKSGQCAKRNKGGPAREKSLGTSTGGKAMLLTAGEKQKRGKGEKKILERRGSSGGKRQAGRGG